MISSLFIYLFIHSFIFYINILKVKTVIFFNNTKLLLKFSQDFCGQIAFMQSVWEMELDHSYLRMLLIDHVVTDDHQILMIIGSENQPKLLAEWKIFKLYQLLFGYCMFDCIFAIYTKPTDLLSKYWHS